MSAGAAVRTKEEVADAIRSLTVAQSARLRKIAEAYRYAMEADDLLQEAFSRALGDDGRHCPKHVDVVVFLAGVMRSIASGEYERAKTRPPLVALANHGGEADGAPDPPDLAAGADDLLVHHQETVGLVQKVLALFDGDAAARDIVEGRMEDMTGEELRELTGLDATGYATKLRLIRRRIDKAFPKGVRG